jgi:hypothetical protein
MIQFFQKKERLLVIINPTKLEKSDTAVHICEIEKPSDWVHLAQGIGLVVLGCFVAIGIVGLLKSYGLISLDSSSWLVKVIDSMGNTPGYCGLWIPTIAAALGGIGLIVLMIRPTSPKQEKIVNLEEPSEIVTKSEQGAIHPTQNKVPDPTSPEKEDLNNAEEPPTIVTNPLSEIPKPEHNNVSNPLLDLIKIYQLNRKIHEGKTILSFALILEIDVGTFKQHRKDHLEEAINKACELITEQIGVGCIFRFDLMITGDGLTHSRKGKYHGEIRAICAKSAKLCGYDAKCSQLPTESCFGLSDHNKDSFEARNTLLEGNVNSLFETLDPEWEVDTASRKFIDAFNAVPSKVKKVGNDRLAVLGKNLTEVLKQFPPKG